MPQQPQQQQGFSFQPQQAQAGIGSGSAMPHSSNAMAMPVIRGQTFRAMPVMASRVNGSGPPTVQYGQPYPSQPSQPQQPSRVPTMGGLPPTSQMQAPVSHYNNSGSQQQQQCAVAQYPQNEF
ncbi:MAG TPA: hypothetical protein EYO58_10235 [Flavobacteriales bacterium]|nr:hypothetical protein [Flavobacteriales bacterium]